jgi:hypothetical protein
MLLFDRNGLYEADAAKTQLEKLGRLAKDIRDLMNGIPPSAEVLEAAPRMSGWRLAKYEMPALIGEVNAHPLLPGERSILTSPIAIIGQEFGWVRTHSRYYRLGPPYIAPDDLN